MKNIIIVLTIVIVFIVLIVYAKPGTNEKKKETVISGETSSISVLQASEKFYDFGTISMKDGNVSKIFQVSNLTNSDVILEKLTTSCMCTVAYIINGGKKKGPFGMPGHGGPVPKANYTIRAGETIGIEAIFDPNAHGPAGVGQIERIVRLEYGNQNILDLNFKAIVTP